MLIGLQVGGGEFLGPDPLRELKDQGVDLARIQAFSNDRQFTVTDSSKTTALVQEIIDAGLRPYVMIRRAVQIADIPEGIDIEFGNEPDLGNRFGWPSAGDYLAATREAIGMAQGRNPLWVGVVSNLNKRGFEFLERMRWATIPGWVGCAVHRYPDGDTAEPNRPSKDRRFRKPGHRDAEIAELRRIVGTRPLGLSEIGYHTADGQTDEQVAANMRWEREFFARHGFEFAIAYQLIDGPENVKEQRYGFRRFTPDGSPFGPWKPVAEAWMGDRSA